MSSGHQDNRRGHIYIVFLLLKDTCLCPVLCQENLFQEKTCNVQHIFHNLSKSSKLCIGIPDFKILNLLLMIPIIYSTSFSYFPTTNWMSYLNIGLVSFLKESTINITQPTKLFKESISSPFFLLFEIQLCTSLVIMHISCKRVINIIMSSFHWQGWMDVVDYQQEYCTSLEAYLTLVYCIIEKLCSSKSKINVSILQLLTIPIKHAISYSIEFVCSSSPSWAITSFQKIAGFPKNLQWVSFDTLVTSSKLSYDLPLPWHHRHHSKKSSKRGKGQVGTHIVILVYCYSMGGTTHAILLPVEFLSKFHRKY